MGVTHSELVLDEHLYNVIATYLIKKKRIGRFLTILICVHALEEIDENGRVSNFNMEAPSRNQNTTAGDLSLLKCKNCIISTEFLILHCWCVAMVVVGIKIILKGVLGYISSE